jgi:membrane-bound lytic murein transglycosylase D
LLLAAPAAGSPGDRDGGDTAVTPGQQSSPPGPPPPSPATLVPDEGKRRAIRGCPVDMECRGADLEGLRAFEIEAFAPQGSPWMDDDDLHGHNALRRGRPTRRIAGEGGHGRPPQKGTDVRPDLPWLDQLVLPDLPMRWDERVIKYLEFYKSDPRGRRIMAGWLRAQGKYQGFILDHLRRARLPEDLLYIAMIESSYDPAEYSRAGASGLWQFMPAGGRIYGLTISRWIDERNDPVQSTRAVMMYFADLYQRFGDWHLALAAYNAGYGAVLRGVATYNTNDFWQLLDYENALPWESGIYVPKALAAAIVGRNRGIFGFDDVPVEPALAWDNVTVPKSVPLSVVARAAGVSVDTIKGLNPQLRRDRTPPSVKDYVVRIPRGTAGLFAERFAQLRADWDKHDAYVVAHGERFEDIATMHGISRRSLANLNGIEAEAEVQGGMILVVPQVSEAAKQKNLEKAREDLYASGAPRGQPGEALLVPVLDKDFRVEGKKRVFYRVVSGDTQHRVAGAFGVPRADLAAWNGLDPTAHLHPRMVLQVFVAETFSAEEAGVALLDESRLLIVTRGSDEHLDEVETRRGRKRAVYKAQGRESFESIGKKVGLSARDLARVNRMPHTTVLEPGQEIIVYQVVDASRSRRAAAQAQEQSRGKRKSKKQTRARKRGK